MSERESTEEPAHDVLAAEAFAVPAPDPLLHSDPLDVPEDPTGIEEPHDVLAAEEFAMPAGRSSGVGGALARGAGTSRWLLGAALAAATLILALRLLRRR